MNGKHHYMVEVKDPTKNKAAFSRVILLIKKCVFTCIMAVYDKKDFVNKCKQKMHFFTPELWRFECLIFVRGNIYFLIT